MMVLDHKGTSLGTTKAFHKQYHDKLVLFDKNELKNQCEFTALTGKQKGISLESFTVIDSLFLLQILTVLNLSCLYFSI